MATVEDQDLGTPAGVATPAPDPANLHNPALYINRELSWLEFNERVLAQARDDAHPLLERVKFLAISAANLDEFFMVRVATTVKKLREGLEDVSIDGHRTSVQLDAMRRRASRMMRDQVGVWTDLRERLGASGVRLSRSRTGPRRCGSTWRNISRARSARC